MQPSEHADNLLRWCATLFRTFADFGITKAYISPGSRSTPLVYAVSECDQIEKHVILDERSAAFQALGSAKATGKPSVLICTSGTVVANYFPAVIEARQSGTPLIICSADRPPSERNTGANQTIDQQNLFGNYPVFFRDAGEPGHDEAEYNRIGHLAGQAVKHSIKQSGPVHLNFPFSKPLEPSIGAVNALKSYYADSGQQTGWQQDNAKTKPPEWIADAVNSAQNPVIICGAIGTGDPLSASVKELSESKNIPLWLESTTLHLCGEKSFTAAGHWVDKLGIMPDLILRFGKLPAGRGLLSFLESAKSYPQIYFRANDLPSEIPGSNQQTFTSERQIDWGDLPVQKSDQLRKACRKAWENYRKQWEDKLNNHNVFTDLHAIDTVIRSNHGTLMLSNSLIVRDADRVPLEGFPGKVISNRGASGIDGITSTAIGGALAGDQVTLVTGDLAFLHDLTALLSAENKSIDLHIVVINNGGGQIFKMLPFTSYDEKFRQYFETPQSVDIQRISRSFNLMCTRVSDITELQDTLLNQEERSGVRITECQTDGEAAIQLRKSFSS